MTKKSLEARLAPRGLATTLQSVALATLNIVALSIATLSFVALSLAGCSHTNDAVSQAEKKDAINGVAVPSLAETKAIAEEGFVFGFPIVMYYTSAYELFVDCTSSQFKAPVGTLFNEARVFTPKDTAVITPNSDTPYSMLEIDLRAEPTVISVPAVPKPRYYSVQLTDANTFNYGYMGSRSTGTAPGDYMIVGPDWNGQTPPKSSRFSIRRPRYPP